MHSTGRGNSHFCPRKSTGRLDIAGSLPRLASPSTIFVALIVAPGRISSVCSRCRHVLTRSSITSRVVEGGVSSRGGAGVLRDLLLRLCPAVHTQFHTPASLPDKSRRIGAPRSGSCVPETLAAGPGIVVNFVCMCEEPESRLAHGGLARRSRRINESGNGISMDLTRVPLVSAAHSFSFLVWAKWSEFEFSRTSSSDHSLARSHLGRTSDIGVSHAPRTSTTPIDSRLND